MNLKGRNFLTLKDFTPEEITYLLDLAAELKDKKKRGVPVDTLRGKNVALIFEKTSTRTRCAFEVAAHDLGMGTTYLDPSGSQIGKKESIEDTARVLGRMFEGIEYRGFGQEIVEELAKYAGVPVWNGLTNEYHPTQMLADLLTVKEEFGRLEGIRLVYMGAVSYTHLDVYKRQIIINAEGIGHSQAMAKRIEAATGIETRATILGHMQRGGSPTCKDRVYASIMGAYAVDLLIAGKNKRIVGYKNGEYVDFDINEALAMQKTIPEYQFEIAKALSYNYVK